MLGGPCITMTGVLMRREETQRHRCIWGECHVMMEPEIEVLQLQAKKFQGFLATTSG